MERPKAVGEFPIRQVVFLKLFLFIIINTFNGILTKIFFCLSIKNRFYSRESGLLNFCLYTSESKGPTLDRRRLVAFTFHPTDPFAISVQRDNFEYVVNFHIRKVYMPE